MPSVGAKRGIMITGGTKNKVDDIWQKMWEGGITNPLEIISQLTYLMFMQQLDEKEYETEKMELASGVELEHIFPIEWTNPQGNKIAGEKLRWSRFKDMDSTTMYTVVSQYAFPFIKTNVHTDSAFVSTMANATFSIPTPNSLEKAVTGITDLFADHMEDIGDLGDLYEYMLSKLNTAGTNGQFRTPKHIRDLMVALIDPKPSQLVCDPACGTAGFLISAAEHVRNAHADEMTASDWECFTGDDGATTQFTGFEIDQTMLRISAMNLLLHGIDYPDIRYLDGISKNNIIKNQFDVILANPPFTGTVDKEAIDDSLLSTVNSKQTELLFVALFLRMLKLGGRCACIVPNGVLFRTNARGYTQLRKELVDNQKLEAIINMPSGVFKPYSAVSTAILVFTKTDAGGTDNVWFYDMTSDGYTLDDKRDPDPSNDDIPDIITRWNNLSKEAKRNRTDKSFMVSKQDIVDNDYDLSFNKYSEITYERIEYPPTSEILADLSALNAQMTTTLAELTSLLEGYSND